MFPLGTVLFPTLVLPLHVFELRYQALVERCLEADDPEFGVVMIERGSEVGGDDARSSVGTVARIVESKRFDDGRWAVVAAGVRRLKVIEWLADDPYPRADVQDWPDTGSVLDLAAPYEAVVRALRRALALSVELGDRAAPATVELASDAVTGSYQAAALAPLGPLDQQRLLSVGGTGERLGLLVELLDDAVVFLEQRLASG